MRHVRGFIVRSRSFIGGFSLIVQWACPQARGGELAQPESSGSDGTRTRDLRRDRLVSTNATIGDD